MDPAVTSDIPKDGSLLGPLDPVTLAGGVAANLATTILQTSAERLRGTTFGRALIKLGLLKPGFVDHLQVALATAIEQYFQENPNYLMRGVVAFLMDPVIVQDLRDHILNGLPIDIAKLTQRLADDLDIPRNLDPGAWPCFNPRELFNGLFSKLNACFGVNADPGVIWISRQLTALNNQADAIQARLEEYRGDLPSIFNTALAEQQSDQWTDFERQFLRHLQNRFGRLATPGARELHGINQSLSIAYISLNVKARGNAEPIPAERFLLDAPLIVIRGPAGSGKTTLLNWITWCCAQAVDSPNPWRGGVPFFIPLRTVARTEAGAPRVSNFVQYSVDSELWSRSEPSGWVHDVLVNQKRAIVMIDGVDELPRSRREEFWNWLTNFTMDYPENRVIVTSRILPGSSPEDDASSTQWNPPPTFVDAHLEEMSNADISNFIEHWHDAVDRSKLDEFEFVALLRAKEELPKKLEDPANRRIRELCSTPLLCALVCVLHWREEGYLPRQQVDLYNRCCDMLIEARDLKRGVQLPSGPLARMTKNDKEMVLQRLAFDMMHNKPDSDEVQTSTYRMEIGREKALDWISPRIASFQDPEARQCTAEEVLDHLIERTGLLREPAGGLVDFPHRTFQEYLAACAAGGEGQEDFLAKQADDDQWHETIMLAAGTTTGGVRFGRALIDALIKRAERHKSNRSRSQRIRKTCFALALGCLENLRQQDPSLRDRVLSHLSELVPPRNDGDARILSVASDAAVPHLQYTDWKDERTSTVAACAQALRLIGTTAATRTLKRGYLSDNRGPVIAEVCRTGSIPYAKVPMVVSAVEETGRLPPYIDLADILLLVGLQNLKNLEVSLPLPRNIEALSHLTHLSNVHVLRIPLDEVSNFPWVPTINSFHLGGCPGNNLSWLEKFTNLQELALYSLTDVQDLASTKSLTTLRALILSHMGFRSLSPLCSLPHLEKIHLRGCPQITDLEPISALANLRQVVIDSCGGLKGINALSHLHLTELSIEDSAGISDLRPMEQMSTLVSLKLDGLRKIESIEPIKGFGELQHITLSRLPLLSELSPIGHLRTLRSLLIHDCRSVKQIPPTNALRNLEKITLSELPLVDDFTAIGETPGLASLRIQNCEQLADLNFISDVQSLRTLRIEGATRLKNIVPVHNLGSLTGLIILRCSELDNLSALSAVSNLERIILVSCRKVTDLAPLAELSKLKEITLADCQNIRNLAVLAKLPNLEKIHLGDFDVKRMQIPEALLPLVQSGGVYVSHRRAIRFKHNYYHRYHYFGRDDPIIIYRHGVETELVSVFPDEIDIELQ